MDCSISTRPWRSTSWEGKESEHWTRPGFMAMRNFLQANGFARSTGGGMLMLTAEGESFLRAWLEQGSVPPPL